MTDVDSSRWLKVLIQRLLPFADAASDDLPLGRLLRLSLFQVSVGIAVVLLNGTLNRVMIVELGIPTWLVAAMISVPLLFAPFRALIGFRSDTYLSSLGWRRVPFIWIGTLLQFGGLAIMPFALLILSGDAVAAPPFAGEFGAALAFLLVGAGLHTTQTAGLALATDLSPTDSRPRVVALLYVMLLVGMAASALVVGALLRDFTQVRLIQVIQGAALLTMVLNLAALWKQEPRSTRITASGGSRPRLRRAWRGLARQGQGSASRLLVTVGLGTAAFSMQDVLLEPYGGEVLRLSVAGSTALTALLAIGTLAGFGVAARALTRGTDTCRLAAMGVLAGIVAFSAVIFADPLKSVALFRAATVGIGFGGGLFAVSTMAAAMALADGSDHSGLALGAWGAVQATAAGASIAAGGAIRDVVNQWATSGSLGPGLSSASVGYSVVYHLEIALLFLTLVAAGPLVRSGRPDRGPARFGLAELPN